MQQSLKQCKKRWQYLYATCQSLPSYPNPQMSLFNHDYFDLFWIFCRLFIIKPQIYWLQWQISLPFLLPLCNLMCQTSCYETWWRCWPGQSRTWGHCPGRCPRPSPGCTGLQQGRVNSCQRHMNVMSCHSSQSSTYYTRYAGPKILQEFDRIAMTVLWDINTQLEEPGPCIQWSFDIEQHTLSSVWAARVSVVGVHQART